MLSCGAEGAVEDGEAQAGGEDGYDAEQDEQQQEEGEKQENELSRAPLNVAVVSNASGPRETYSRARRALRRPELTACTVRMCADSDCEKHMRASGKPNR
eukprot:7944-Eustigmatos_ZCMA.PRE.1